MKPLRIFKQPAFRTIIKTAQAEKIKLYLVGGALRTHFSRPDDDIDNVDFVVIGEVGAFAERIAKALKSRTVIINPQFDTVMVPAKKIEFEFTGPRKLLRGSAAHCSLPDDPLEKDLILRDFSINSLAMQLSPEAGNIIDLCGGLEDIKSGIIRTPLDPNVTLREDPLRIMRAARLSSDLNFSIEPDLLEAMYVHRHTLLDVSIERRTSELMRILSTPKPSVGLKLLYITGALDIAFPEIAAMASLEQNHKPRHKDVFEHTLKVVDSVAENRGTLPTRLAALLHDIGKPATRRFDSKSGWMFHGHEVVGQRMTQKLGKKWKLSSAMTDNVSKLVRLHMRPINLSDEGVTDSAVRRLGVQAGEDIDELIKLCRADVTSSDPRRVKKYLANFERVVAHLEAVEERDELRSFQSPVRGDIIMAETGIAPGPLVGKLKKMIEEAILDGIIPNEYDAALEYLRQIKDDVVDDS